MTGPELREKRIAHGLTQKAIAQLLGYKSANYIARLERGEEPITERLAHMVQIMLPGKKTKKSSKEA